MLNSGNYFAAPFESRYSKIRRFLSVNAKMNLESIHKYLGAQNPSTRDVLKLICEFQDKSTEYQDIALPIGGKIRQCGECAKSLFHTNLFNIPWIESCPIHDTPLKENCPSCGKSWPVSLDILSRKCSICGPCVEHWKLAAPVDSLPITLLNCLLKYGAHEIQLVNPSFMDTESRVSNAVPTQLYQFAKEVQFIKLNYFKALPLIDTCPIDIASCSAKASIKQSASEYYRLDFLKDDSEYLKRDFKIFSRIRGWLKCHSHSFTFQNIGDLSFTSIRKEMSTCPYCFALTLWLVLVTTDKLGSGFQKALHSCSFLEELNINMMLRPMHEYHFIYGNESIYPPENIRLYLYEKILEQSYLALLKMILEIREHSASQFTYSDFQKLAHLALNKPEILYLSCHGSSTIILFQKYSHLHFDDFIDDYEFLKIENSRCSRPRQSKFSSNIDKQIQSLHENLTVDDFLIIMDSIQKSLISMMESWPTFLRREFDLYHIKNITK